MKLGWIAALALLATACGGGGADNEDVVRDAAQEHADRHSAGDFAGEWDTWTSAAQDAVPQDDFVTYEEACAGTGLPIKVDDVRVDGDTATVRLAIGDASQAYEMRREDDEWRWVPSDATLENLSGGSTSAIAASQADGSCVED